ncbi:hypothetical protein JOQ06_004836 [Pogonophryne albipinna]|uniref:ShKT domain-containing protein n=1 Tax=Pogonophryne albipinna TaxID=1090488 RepID=A0AAD6AP99_9TELE|nr:hypothetical protein JOQ06_004836 [Pogonophryne albipinna]
MRRPSCGDCPNACNNKLCTNPCPYADKYSNCPDLKQQPTCSNADVASWCPASCKCTSQIIYLSSWALTYQSDSIKDTSL